MLYYIKPVSYTHLDVYKRQLIFWYIQIYLQCDIVLQGGIQFGIDTESVGKVFYFLTFFRAAQGFI